MDKNINFLEIVKLMLHRVWIIIIAAVVVGGAFFSYSYYFISPIYLSKGMIYVDNSNILSFPKELAIAKDVEYADMVASQRLATTYIEILKSQTFLSFISQRVGSNISPAQIGSLMSIISKNDTEILEISVVHTDPQVATFIVQTILDNSKNEIPRIFKGGSVEIIDNAQVPTGPSGPNYIKYTLVGILVGILAGGLLIFLLDLLDNRVKSQNDLIERYNLPVLGSIPSMERLTRSPYSAPIKTESYETVMRV